MAALAVGAAIGISVLASRKSPEEVHPGTPLERTRPAPSKIAAAAAEKRRRIAATADLRDTPSEHQVQGHLGDSNEHTSSVRGNSKVDPHIFRCTPSLHTCPVDVVSGCPSCHRTCHTNCDDDKCEFEPCAFCVSLALITHQSSDHCIDMQTRNIGCHSCGRLNCWSAAGNCHARCSAHRHVCGPGDNALGCSSCGRLCHESNADTRCTFYARMRGNVSCLMLLPC